MLTIGERILAWTGAVGCLTVLTIAAFLYADKEGHGTHEQLGLPGCIWLATYDTPCPTCGMTTAFASTTDWKLTSAVHAQPMGTLLAVMTAAAFWVFLHSAIFGSRAIHLAMELVKPKIVWMVLAIWLGSWAYRLVTWPGG